MQLVLLFVLAGTCTAAAANEPAMAHVRGADATARRLLATVVQESETARALVAYLQRTDLIVIVETGLLPHDVNGVAQVVAATPTFRYVRIRLRLPNSAEALLEVLGHELYHAFEISGMPEVRDDASLGAAYRRVGWAATRAGFFETRGALEAGRLVSREVAVRRYGPRVRACGPPGR